MAAKHAGRSGQSSWLEVRGDGRRARHAAGEPDFAYVFERCVRLFGSLKREGLGVSSWFALGGNRRMSRSRGRELSAGGSARDLRIG